MTEMIYFEARIVSAEFVFLWLVSATPLVWTLVSVCSSGVYRFVSVKKSCFVLLEEI